MNKLTIYALFYLFFLPKLIFAQSANTIDPYTSFNQSSIVAPNSIASGKNVSAGSLFNGSTSIYIPFYEQTLNGINFNIGLVTNTKGVKVDEFSGVFGLHWSLQGGGTIVKYVNDIDDDDSGFTIQNSINESRIRIYGKNTFYDNFYTYPSNYDANLKVNNSRSVHYDNEYDIYQFSVGNYNFSFRIVNDVITFIAPNHDVKINIVGNDFLVTDNKGNEYHFAYHGRKSNIGSIGRFSDSRDYKVEIGPKIWLLQKIIFPNNKEVRFFYNDLNDSKAEFCNYSYNVKDRHPYSYNTINIKEQFKENSLPILDSVSFPNGTNIALRYSYYKRCDNIVDYHEWNDFDLKSLGVTPLLDTVIVYNKDFVIQKYKQHYSYIKSTENTITYLTNAVECFPVNRIGDFNYITNNSAKIRIQLDSIQLLGHNNSSLLYYKFDYYNNLDDGDVMLPPRLSMEKDLFGYYTNSNFHLSDLINNNVEPVQNLTYMRANAIKRLTDGRGLITEYEYELHEANNVKNFNINKKYDMYYPNNSTLKAMTDTFILRGKTSYDGLRLKKVTIIDPTMKDGNVLHKNYSYNRGMTFLIGGIHHMIKDNYNGTQDLSRSIHSTNRFTDPGMLAGSNLGYTYVTETVTNGSNQVLSKNVSEFSNLVTESNSGSTAENYYDKNGLKHYFELPYTQKQYIKDYKIGLLVNTKSYDGDNNILSEVNYEYEFREDIFNPTHNPGNIKQYNIDVHAHDNYVDTFSIFSGSAKVKKIESRDYVSNTNFLTTQQSFTYDDKGNVLTETMAVESDNTVLEKRYYYPKDFLTSTNAITRNIAQKLVDKNILYDMGLKVMKRDNTNARILVMQNSFNQYSLNGTDVSAISKFNLIPGSKDWNTLPYTTDIEKNEGTLIIAGNGNTLPSYKSGSIYTMLSDDKLPLEIKSEHNMYTTNIYDDETSTLIASCNTPYADFGYVSFEEENTKPNTTFNIGNLVTMTPINSSNVSYLSFSGSKMYRMQANESFKFTNILGKKKYIVGGWITNATTTPATNIIVRVNGLDYPIKNSENIKYGVWFYFQVEVDIPSSDVDIEVINNGITTVYCDDFVVAPLGSTYKLNAFDRFGRLTKEMTLNGKLIQYHYDDFNRLFYTADENGNIIEQYEYKLN